MAPRAVKFPVTLYQMVSSDAEEIGWSSDGRSFWVSNPDGLASRVVPNYFEHSSYASFTRSLNAHGFHKLTASTWSHPLFHRDKPEQLGQIGRKHADGHRPKATQDTAKLLERLVALQQAAADRAKRPALKAQWEYKSIFGDSRVALEEEMNQFGQDGWEFFNITSFGRGNAAFARRPIGH